MTTNQKLGAPKSKASTRTSLFGPPPLFEGEDPKLYNELLMRVSSAVKPSDFIEEIWVRDIVDLSWKIFRWRQLETKFFNVNIAAFDFGEFEKVELVDRLMTIAEGRRNAILREIDRRRSVLAQILRGTVREIEATEFKSIEPKAIAPKSAADKNAA